MSMTKYNPINNWVENFLNNDFSNFLGSDSIVSMPKVNVRETEKGFNLELAAPGLEKEDFNIEVDDNTLKISVSKESKEEETTDKFTRKEYNYHSFKRAFSLPANIDPGMIAASYKNGILHLEIPKTAESAKLVKKIEIG